MSPDWGKIITEKIFGEVYQERLNEKLRKEEYEIKAERLGSDLKEQLEAIASSLDISGEDLRRKITNNPQEAKKIISRPEGHFNKALHLHGMTQSNG